MFGEKNEVKVRKPLKKIGVEENSRRWSYFVYVNKIDEERVMSERSLIL
jgi:hypothetical protein